ncbi:AraC family transcriptional regulator, partial [Bacteroides sp. OttesenSCG-928-D19]|nr:AraC family transcriptional regulator [Bacteroides sp. OttesenSCG-928-D19]
MNKEELKRNFILLNVGYAYHNADWNWKDIHSPFTRIHYVKRGTAKIIREDGVIELKENHLYLTPSYVKHGYECNEVLELYYVHIYEDPGKNLSIFDLIDFPVEVESNFLDIHLIERLITINPASELQYYDPDWYDNSATVAQNMALRQRSSLAFDMETQGIVRQLISRFLAKADYKKEHPEPRILNCLHYIHKNIDLPIEIDHLASLCFLTKDHFIRLFHKEMNCTPGKYINRKKIETAQLRILLDNTKSINDIAYGLGFENISYFSRLFTKITGERPGSYKKRIQP